MAQFARGKPVARGFAGMGKCERRKKRVNEREREREREDKAEAFTIYHLVSYERLVLFGVNACYPLAGRTKK